MATAKDEMIGIINEQPDDSSYDELLRELSFKRMVNNGLKDFREGRTISNEETQRRMQSWQK
jgi:hypothetical protein